MINNPCLECDRLYNKRYVGCHAECAKYLKYKQDLAKLRKSKTDGEKDYMNYKCGMFKISR